MTHRTYIFSFIFCTLSVAGVRASAATSPKAPTTPQSVFKAGDNFTLVRGVKVRKGSVAASMANMRGIRKEVLQKTKQSVLRQPSPKVLGHVNALADLIPSLSAIDFFELYPPHILRAPNAPLSCQILGVLHAQHHNVQDNSAHLEGVNKLITAAQTASQLKGITPASILKDGLDSRTIRGVKGRKGSILAIIRNVQALEAAHGKNPAAFADNIKKGVFKTNMDTLAELAPIAWAIGLFDEMPPLDAGTHQGAPRAAAHQHMQQSLQTFLSQKEA
ncbi:MAG: hypothetical protein ACPG7U_03565 [Holosporaceae bacterium]